MISISIMVMVSGVYTNFKTYKIIHTVYWISILAQ